MLSLYFVHYNFVRIHKTLKCTPALAAGVTDTLRDMEWIVSLIDARAAKAEPPRDLQEDFKLRHYPRSVEATLRHHGRGSGARGPPKGLCVVYRRR